ncbi:MAG: hypothetical protein O2999_13185 [Nitrospirae bacterium]|nr:hypothetical protein [Nitrospirota bacterium]MDA1305227.1 hypothetical protein [Nitrospirota bacterium]
MKIILDECVPRRLAGDLPHEVSTVQQLKLSGLDNGALLKAIERDFDVFVTVDQNLQYQQNLSESNIAILVLVTGSNRYNDLKLLIPSCLSALDNIRPGQIKIIQT